jgi:hypothetical protein
MAWITSSVLRAKSRRRKLGSQQQVKVKATVTDAFGLTLNSGPLSWSISIEDFLCDGHVSLGRLVLNIKEVMEPLASSEFICIVCPNIPKPEELGQNDRVTVTSLTLTCTTGLVLIPIPILHSISMTST